MLKRDFCVGFGLLVCVSTTACTSTNSTDNVLTKQSIWDDDVFSWETYEQQATAQQAESAVETAAKPEISAQVKADKAETQPQAEISVAEAKAAQTEPQAHLKDVVLKAELEQAEPKPALENPINQSDITLLASVSAENLASIVPAAYTANASNDIEYLESVEVVEEAPEEENIILETVNNLADKVIGVARSMLGIPYVWGGNKPDKGFDCSGLVQYSFSWADVTLPRTAAAQYNYVTPVAMDELLPGDIVFFKTSRRARVTHNGIYIGDGQFIHAPSKGKTIRYAKLNNSYWKKRIVGAGRVDKLHHVPCVPSNGENDSEIVEIKPKSKEYL